MAFTHKKLARLRASTPYVLLTLAPLCWAGNVVLARGVIDLIPPISFAFWRWALAFAILLPFARGHLGRQWGDVRRAWKSLLLLSLLGISCFNALLYSAVHTTTAINAALIQTAMPAVIILISLLRYREKSHAVQLAGVSLSIAGAVLIVIRGSLSALLQMKVAGGDLLVSVAVVSYALYSVLLRERPAIHPLAFLAATFGLGALGLLPLSLWELAAVGPPKIDFRVALSILYVAVFPSILAYFCWNRGVERIGANRAGLFINLVPVFASALAILLLGESIRWFHLAGLALIFGGVRLSHVSAPAA